MHMYIEQFNQNLRISRGALNFAIILPSPKFQQRKHKHGQVSWKRLIKLSFD